MIIIIINITNSLSLPLKPFRLFNLALSPLSLSLSKKKEKEKEKKKRKKRKKIQLF
jgi:hypothetical protein